MSVRSYLEGIIWLRAQHELPEQQNEWAHTSYESLVLSEGREFDVNPRPKGVRQRKMGYCFMNALEYALKDPGRYQYVEGYGIHLIPTLHAWVYDRETGLLIDNTWKEQETNGYFGIEFPLSYLFHSLSKAGTYGVIGNDYVLDCELLKEGSIAWQKNGLVLGSSDSGQA